MMIIVGCGENRIGSSKNPNRINEPYSYCIDGVIYYGIDRGAAPAYNRDGSLKLCDVEVANGKN